MFLRCHDRLRRDRPEGSNCLARRRRNGIYRLPAELHRPRARGATQVRDVASPGDESRRRAATPADRRIRGAPHHRLRRPAGHPNSLPKMGPALPRLPRGGTRWPARPGADARAPSCCPAGGAVSSVRVRALCRLRSRHGGPTHVSRRASFQATSEPVRGAASSGRWRRSGCSHRPASLPQLELAGDLVVLQGMRQPQRLGQINSRHHAAEGYGGDPAISALATRSPSCDCTRAALDQVLPYLGQTGITEEDTSRNPDDLPAFCRDLIRALAKTA